MAISYKQKCRVCQKNYVEVTRRNRQAICWECQKKQMSGDVKDPKMKKMLTFPRNSTRKACSYEISR